MKVKPMGMLLMMLAGWINRHHRDVIVYLKEENKILREKLGTKRILLNDNQRMRLARLGDRDLRVGDGLDHPSRAQSFSSAIRTPRLTLFSA